jgi:hypothetical protein
LAVNDKYVSMSTPGATGAVAVVAKQGGVGHEPGRVPAAVDDIGVAIAIHIIDGEVLGHCLVIPRHLVSDPRQEAALAVVHHHTERPVPGLQGDEDVGKPVAVHVGDTHAPRPFTQREILSVREAPLPVVQMDRDDLVDPVADQDQIEMAVAVHVYGSDLARGAAGRKRVLGAERAVAVVEEHEDGLAGYGLVLGEREIYVAIAVEVGRDDRGRQTGRRRKTGGANVPSPRLKMMPKPRAPPAIEPEKEPCTMSSSPLPFRSATA